MSETEKILGVSSEKVEDSVPFSKDSGFSTFFAILGLLSLVFGFFLMTQCSEARGDSSTEFGIVAIICVIVAFNGFFAAYIVNVLSNIRWYTYKTSLNNGGSDVGSSEFSEVVKQLKTISDQKNEQSNSTSNNQEISELVDAIKFLTEQNNKEGNLLRDSIGKLTQKNDDTNVYLHHILKNVKKGET